MAIVKVGTYRNPPEDITDYEAIVAHLEAYTRQVGNQGMILTEWTNTTNAPKIAMGSYISHGGVLYVVEDEDYIVTTAIEGYQYFRVWASGDTLIIDTVSSVVGYSWNAIYNGLYNVSGNQILPYQFNMNAGTGLYEKYKMLNPWQVNDFAVVDYLGRYHGRELHVTGAISGATVNTGQGANELYPMNQAVRTTDNVSFANLNPPVDNADSSLPSIGIGGFTYGTSDGNSNITLPTGGTYITMGFRNGGDTMGNLVGRFSGGTELISSFASKIFVWRIA